MGAVVVQRAAISAAAASNITIFVRFKQLVLR
jgi:hypothetical protein